MSLSKEFKLKKIKSLNKIHDIWMYLYALLFAFVTGTILTMSMAKGLCVVAFVLVVFVIPTALERSAESGLFSLPIEEQTEEICLEAVRKKGLDLQYVKEQTKEICLEAVNQNGHALKHVKNQTPEIIYAAVKQNDYAVNHINTGVFPIKNWDTEWFKYIDSVEKRRVFIKEHGNKIFQQLESLEVVSENNEYCLVRFKYTKDQTDFQKALIFKCPSSGDVYFQEVKPTLITIKSAVKFLNNGITKDQLAFES